MEITSQNTGVEGMVVRIMVVSSFGIGGVINEHLSTHPICVNMLLSLSFLS